MFSSLEIDKNRERKKEASVYKSACQKCGVTCMSRYGRQIGSSIIDLSNASLSCLQLSPILCTIMV